MQDNELVEWMPEEKVIESALADRADDLFYLNAFKEAKEAFWQREGDTISECDARCISVLKHHFVPRAIIPIVRAEILQGLADAAASWGSKTAEEIATAIRNQEPTDAG